MGIDWWSITNYIGCGILINIDDIKNELKEDENFDFYPITNSGNPNTLVSIFIYLKPKFQRLNRIEVPGPYEITRCDKTMSISIINNITISNSNAKLIQDKYFEITNTEKDVKSNWYNILTTISSYYNKEYEEYDLEIWNKLISELNS